MAASSAVAAHHEPPSIFFYRCWSGVCGKGYEDVVLECLRASGASRAAASVAPHASVAQVLWSNTFQQKLVEAMPAHALCNHFPRSTELSHKHRLCRWMRRSTRCRRFTPRGFVLPDEAAEWATAAAAAERPEAKAPPPPPSPSPPPRPPRPQQQEQEQQQQEEEQEQQQQQQQQRLWIVKPAQAGGGRHVRVLGGAAAVGEEAARCAASKQLKRASHSAVAQEYVERPLLIRGRKFDLRLYVLVTDVGGNASAAAASGAAAAPVAAGLGGKAPPRAFLFREGFVRFASEAYSLAPPFSKFAHLTNNAVNRKNVAGGEASLANWSLSQLSSWMRHARSGSGGGSGEGGGVGGGCFEAQVWGCVRELVAAVLLGVSVPLADALLQARARVSEAGGGQGDQTAEQAAVAEREEGRAEGSSSRSSSSGSSNSFGCFELFGFDVLIDEELRPWLLEVNAQPALGVGGALDMAIDRAMLQALFGIVLGDDSPAAAAAPAPAHPLPTARDFDRLPHPALCVFEDLAVELAAAAE